MEKNYLIVADTYYPDKNSAAHQLRDLARELVRQGDTVIVLTARQDQGLDYYIGENETLILKSSGKSPKNTKNYIERQIVEITLPFRLFRTIQKYNINLKNINLYVYSPSIFLFIFRYLTRIPKHNSILILRDLFPYWAFDVGLIKSKFIFMIFEFIARLQYRSFSRVYCQSERDTNFIKTLGANTYTLPNWLSDINLDNKKDVPKRLEAYLTSGRPTVVYAGKVSEAQNLKKFVEIAIACISGSFQFLIIGSGSQLEEVKKYAEQYNLTNLLIHNEVEQEILTNVLRQCEVGYVSLNKNIISENVPGKFINYLANGLYVLCDCGENRELEKYFENYKIGCIVDIDNGETGLHALMSILKGSDAESNESIKCFQENFNVRKAVERLKERE